MAHVAKWKEVEVDNIIKLISDKPVIGLVNIRGIPGPQLQKMRQNLRDRATLKITLADNSHHGLKEYRLAARMSVEWRDRTQ